MKVEDLLGQSGEWLKGTGPENDVVISSRIRLARNLNRFPFLTVASAQARGEVERFVRSHLESSKLPKQLVYWPLPTFSPIERTLLVERHLISKELAQAEGDRGVAVAPDESISIMVNEEDHLRLQVIRSGLQLDEAYDEIDRMDTALEGALHFAFDSRFGYLTACPTNAGTGLRISVMMHLPAVALAKQVDKVLQSLQRLNYNVRGFYGEGTSPLGDFYQVSNQVTLGKGERDLIADLKKVVPEILRFERAWRHKLLEDEPKRLEDKVWRAYGVLKNARRMTSEEATDLLSSLRLGVNLNIITGIPTKTLNELFIYTQPGHLQKLERRILEPDERDIVRAELIRRKLEGL
jgi:protein arginine kinase